MNRCITCYYYDSKENLCLHGSPIFIDNICTDYQDNECVERIRADAVNECAELFAETLSNMKQICGNNCPIKCEWGTDETCKNACKDWFIKQIREKQNV